MNVRLNFEQTAYSNGAVQDFLGTPLFGTYELDAKLLFKRKDGFNYPINDKIEVESKDGLYIVNCRSFYSYGLATRLKSFENFFKWDSVSQILSADFVNGTLEISKA